MAILLNLVKSFRPRRAARNRQPAQTGLCYYHAAFGTAAAIAVRHVRGFRLATRHAFRETPVPATACEHSRWQSIETVSRSRLPVRRELFG